MKRIFIALSLVLMFCKSFAQKAQYLANKPPMGWNSWNTFYAGINEQTIMSIVDSLVSSGLLNVGYSYVVIDDGWSSHQRDSLGNLKADSVKFPHGIKYISDYLHDKGLKFGIYSCAGDLTCGGYPGSRGHEYQDALMFAKWGVDYLKYDWCYAEKMNAQESYRTMSNAIHSSGRNMLFSICEWGNNQPWLWDSTVGHMWRTTSDIIATWYDNKIDSSGRLGFLKIVDKEENLRAYAGPGRWNDPDMLEVGNGMSESEDRAHFSLWAMLAAPLILGNDLRAMKPSSKEIISNKEVIVIDQDSLGIQAFKHRSKDSIDWWVKPLSDDGWCICFLNRSLQKRMISVDLNKEQIVDSVFHFKMDIKKHSYIMRDLWKHKNIGLASSAMQVSVLPHDVTMIKLIVKE